MISRTRAEKLSSLLVIAALCSLAFAQTAADSVRAITVALQSRNFEQALQLIEPALQASPKNPQLWMLQGLAYSGKGDQKQALASFQSVLKIAPDYLPALEGAAEIAYETGSEEAVPLLQHVLRLRPGEQTSHAMLGVIAYKRGDCAQAVKEFEQSGRLIEAQPAAMQEYGACPPDTNRQPRGMRYKELQEPCRVTR